MSSVKKIRLDKLLFDKGLVESREKAKALIMEGNVLVNGIVADKAGALMAPDNTLAIENKMPFVSRGGLKLEHALNTFDIDVKDKIAMDVGASTGGFTDCLLQRGAKKVYAIDVGYGQLDWRLRNDPRVILLEKTNIRYLEEIIGGQRAEEKSGVKSQESRVEKLKDLLNRNIDFATIDVSFISLLKVLPKVLEFLAPQGEIIALIKPQFEVGKKDVGKGVVRDEDKRLEVVEAIKSGSEEMGLEVRGLTPSPIKGPKGNVEYLIYMNRRRA
ncbi:MAG: TlyA family RNA methyltransferase [Nitrospiraceae bacterium]|nr:MAG: TlyA family RNA methyltransferase [Nitrospiraceae bacterium]